MKTQYTGIPSKLRKRPEAGVQPALESQDNVTKAAFDSGDDVYLWQ